MTNKFILGMVIASLATSPLMAQSVNSDKVKEAAAVTGDTAWNAALNYYQTKIQPLAGSQASVEAHILMGSAEAAIAASLTRSYKASAKQRAVLVEKIAKAEHEVQMAKNLQTKEDITKKIKALLDDDKNFTQKALDADTISQELKTEKLQELNSLKAQLDNSVNSLKSISSESEIASVKAKISQFEVEMNKITNNVKNYKDPGNRSNGRFLSLSSDGKVAVNELSQSAALKRQNLVETQQLDSTIRDSHRDTSVKYKKKSITNLKLKAQAAGIRVANVVRLAGITAIAVDLGGKVVLAVVTDSSPSLVPVLSITDSTLNPSEQVEKLIQYVDSLNQK